MKKEIRLEFIKLVNSKKFILMAICGTDAIAFSPATLDTAASVHKFVGKLLDEMEKLKCTADIVFEETDGGIYNVKPVLRANGDFLLFTSTNRDLAEEMRDFLQDLIDLLEEGVVDSTLTIDKEKNND